VLKVERLGSRSANRGSAACSDVSGIAGKDRDVMLSEAIVPRQERERAGQHRLVATALRICRVAGRRLGLAVLALWGTVTVVFVLEQLSGSPVLLLTPPTAPPAERAAIARSLGLDRPIFVQYWHYLTGLLRGNLGTSYFYHQSVASLVAQMSPATLELAGVAMAIAVVIGIPLGMLAAFRHGHRDDGAVGHLMALGQAAPQFLVAPLLISLFAVRLHLVPVSGRAGISSIVLPAVTLALFPLAVLFRVSRGAALSALGEGYVEVAKAKGCRPLRLACQHILPNTLLPIMTVAGFLVGGLIGATVIVETIFSWPGIGYLMIQAVQVRDFPIVSGVTIVFAAAYITVNTLVDLTYTMIDPRVKA
jgi:peptide/nickel transport system permease protein